MSLAEGAWENWSGSVHVEPTSIHRPQTEEQLRTVVEQAPGTVRVAGAGHSFPPVVATDETLVSLDRYSGLVRVDPDAGRVTVRAGTRLGELTASLADHDLMLANMGDIDEQTVAGALATGTHGTGTGFGVLATQLARIRLVTASGGTVELSPRDDWFPAAQVSLGALGVVSEVTLDVVDDYRLVERKYPMGVDDVLGSLEDLREHRHAEFWWFPHTETALVKTLDVTDDPVDTGWRDTLEERVENLVWEAACRTSTRIRRLAGPLNRGITATFSRSERVGPAREIFPTTRAVRFDETEYGLPRGDAVAAFRELRETIEAHDVMFPVEFRDVARDAIPLSPAYNRDSTFLAVHAYHRRDHDPLVGDVEAVFDRYDGRPHWGKHHTKTAAELAPLYPEWDRFQAVRAELDPDGVFLNDHLQAVFADR